MKFSEISEEQWEELRPYLDTCLLPLTGLTGNESPWMTAKLLEQLRDALDLVEIPFRGRTVTYPAQHFTAGKSAAAEGELLRQICRGVRSEGFRYVVLVTAQEEERLSSALLEAAEADRILRFTPQRLAAEGAGAKQAAAELLTTLWAGSNP
ncbi:MULTISPECIES: DUF2487 family protein [Paenibacillus]|uniref:DUF2487 family protein n=1 Tax=Paenibacillus TaxID=44249 RepID=UPI0022B8FBF0|nr:DUF2487 family protein [Paenibacillus caseinilyticus]MCZ8520515.1 DUF2487 family protein [Paenibacillus caseinilyticus]